MNGVTATKAMAILGTAGLALLAQPRHIAFERPAASPAGYWGAGAAWLVPGAEPIKVDWKTLGLLNYRTGDAPDALRKLDGQVIQVPGFIVPLEDYAQQATEFLVVPYFGACIHLPPPPPNQMVYVKMEGDKATSIGMYDPVWVVGTLRIESFQSAYGDVGFTLVGQKVLPYKE